ncbi:hypothetical protein NKG05_00120 [Oerskovia sp. M15]
MKAVNADRLTADGAHPRASICQVEGGRWITLEGTISVSRDPDEISEAVRRYTRRYKEPRVNPRRVVLRLVADKVMSSSYMAF